MSKNKLPFQRFKTFERVGYTNKKLLIFNPNLEYKKNRTSFHHILIVTTILLFLFCPEQIPAGAA